MISLTDRQVLLWRLKRRGLSLGEIAKELGVSRQAVHKGLRVVEGKIRGALLSTAKACRIDVREVDAKRGYLWGWSPWMSTEVYVTFSAKNGVQVWFRHEADCRNCPLQEECRRILLSEAEERGIDLRDDEDVEPSELAEEFFSKLVVGGRGE